MTVASGSATGVQRWASRYNDPARGDDYAFDLAVSPDGTRVFVTGQSAGANGSFADFATVAYDALTGEELWVMRFGYPGLGWEVAHAIGVSPDSLTVFVTGCSGDEFCDNADFVTIAYDAATGAQKWRRRYRPGEVPVALGVVQMASSYM